MRELSLHVVAPMVGRMETTKMATKSKKKSPAVPADVQQLIESPVTMQTLLDGYIEHMEQVGKSPGTTFSYKVELEGAVAEIGADTPLKLVTEDWVRRYFESDRAMKTKHGGLKSKLTVDKSRRVLRLALVWAVGKGWIESAPLPGADAPQVNSAA